MPEIKSQYIDTGKLRFVVRDLPLPFHPYAAKAAEATHCAAEQAKFWDLRNKLTANGDKLEETLLPEYARQAGLDVEKFAACLHSGRYGSQIKRAYPAPMLRTSPAPLLLSSDGRTATPWKASSWWEHCLLPPLTRSSKNYSMRDNNMEASMPRSVAIS